MGEVMHLDEFGLPVQKNGDNQDQLQRVGMIGVGQQLNKDMILLNYGVINDALLVGLQPSEGLYRRFTGGPLNTATGDQLVPVMAYWTIKRNAYEMDGMRWVFAQNTISIFGGSKTVPDFILFRMIPFLVRMHWVLYPLCVIMDVLLILAVISRIWAGSETDTDDNNTIITVAVCKAIMPTPLSFIAAKLYKYGRRAPGLVGALRAYHAASTGGNPEVAELWVPIVKNF